MFAFSGEQVSKLLGGGKAFQIARYFYFSDPAEKQLNSKVTGLLRCIFWNKWKWLTEFSFKWSLEKHSLFRQFSLQLFFLWKIPQNCFFSLIITFKCIVFLAMTQRPKEDDRHFHHPLWPIFMILRKLAMLSKLTIDVSLHQNKLRKFWWKLKEWEHCLYSIFLGHFLVKKPAKVCS